MGRLIDADALRHEIHCAYSDDLGILEHIDAQQTVDAVPVVRCNECQYFRTHDKDVGFCMMSHCLKRINGYCDDAERKDGEQA